MPADQYGEVYKTHRGFGIRYYDGKARRRRSGFSPSLRRGGGCWTSSCPDSVASHRRQSPRRSPNTSTPTSKPTLSAVTRRRSTSCGSDSPTPRSRSAISTSTSSNAALPRSPAG